MKTYSIQLTLEQWQVIGGALGELPMKTAAPVFAEINKQLAEQTKPSVVETLAAAE
jgi:hypothetical protein